MYCERCGRQLKDGEKCVCQQNNQKIVKKSGAAAPAKKKTAPKKGFNGKVFVSFAFLLIGAALFVCFHFADPEWIDALQIPDPYNIKEYIFNALPMVFFLIGAIVGILAAGKKRFRAGAYLGITFNIIGVILMGGLTAWLGYQNYQMDRLIEGELTAEAREKIYAAYNEAEDGAPVREKIESRLSAKLSEIVQNYNDGNLAYEEAKEKATDITAMNIAENTAELQNELDQLHTSKENFDKAAELEAGEDTLLQAVELYAQVQENDSNYETAQKKAEEITAQVSDIIAGGITEENIATFRNFYKTGDAAVKGKVVQEAEKRSDAIKTDFTEKKISLEEAKSDLSELKEFSEAQKHIEGVLADIENINTSSLAFDQAAELEKDDASLMEAIACYEKVTEQDPNYGEAQKRIEELHKKIDGMIQTGISPENIEIMAKIYQASDDEVKAQLDQKAKEYLQTMKDSLARGTIDYEKAEEQLTALEAFAGAADEITALHADIDRICQSQQSFQEAEELAKNPENLLEAVKKYQAVAEDDSNYKKAQERISELLETLVQNCMQDASALAEEKKYKEAIDTLDDCLEIVPDNAQLQQARETYSADYVNYAMSEAQLLLSEQKYNEAKSVLNAAFHVTEDPLLQETYETIDGYRPVAIADMHVMNGHDYEVSDMITDSYGNEHYDAMRINAGSNGCLLYQLDGQYSRFVGNVVSPDEGTSSEANMNFAIFADDVLVYSAANITRQQGAKEISLDLTGVQQIMFQTTGTDYWNSNLCITEGEFEKNPDAGEPSKAYCRLSENVVIDYASAETYDGLMADAYGNFHNGSLKLNASDGGYVLYNLNGVYANLSGKIVAANDTDVNATIGVEIYLDDELAYTSPKISKTTESAAFSLDVTGRKVLKIVASGNNVDYWNPSCYIVDDKLYFESTQELKQQEQETLTKTEEILDETAIHRYEYYLLDGTWEEAFLACISRGGYLVRINSQEEYDYILQQIDKEEFRKYQFYIGGRRDLGSQEYYWAENSNELSGIVLNDPNAWCASNWMLGEPTFEDTTLDVEEHVMNMFYYSDEGRWVWNDVPNNLPDVAPNYKGKIGYICEFDE